MKEYTWMAIGVITMIGMLVLTGLDKMPPEVMSGLAGVVISAIFGELRVKAKESAWSTFYEAEQKKWQDEAPK